MYDVHDDVWDSEVVAVSSLLLQGSNPSDDIVNGSSKRWGVVEPGRLPHISDGSGRSAHGERVGGARSSAGLL